MCVYTNCLDVLSTQRHFSSSLGRTECGNDIDDDGERDEPGAGWRVGPPAERVLGTPRFYAKAAVGPVCGA